MIEILFTIAVVAIIALLMFRGLRGSPTTVFRAPVYIWYCEELDALVTSEIPKTAYFDEHGMHFKQPAILDGEVAHFRYYNIGEL